MLGPAALMYALISATAVASRGRDWEAEGARRSRSEHARSSEGAVLRHWTGPGALTNALARSGDPPSFLYLIGAPPGAGVLVGRALPFVDFSGSSLKFLFLLHSFSTISWRSIQVLAAVGKTPGRCGLRPTVRHVHPQRLPSRGYVPHFLSALASPSTVFLLFLMIYIGPCYQAASRPANDDTTQH